MSLVRTEFFRTPDDMWNKDFYLWKLYQQKIYCETSHSLIDQFADKGICDVVLNSSTNCQSSLTVCVLPTLSSWDVPGSTCCEAPLKQSLNFWLHLWRQPSDCFVSHLSLPLAHLLGTSFGFQAHKLTWNRPPVLRTKAKEASLAEIQQGRRS